MAVPSSNLAVPSQNLDDSAASLVGSLDANQAAGANPFGYVVQSIAAPPPTSPAPPPARSSAAFTTQVAPKAAAGATMAFGAPTAGPRAAMLSGSPPATWPVQAKGGAQPLPRGKQQASSELLASAPVPNMSSSIQQQQQQQQQQQAGAAGAASAPGSMMQATVAHPAGTLASVPEGVLATPFGTVMNSQVAPKSSSPAAAAAASLATGQLGGEHAAAAAAAEGAPASAGGAGEASMAVDHPGPFGSMQMGTMMFTPGAATTMLPERPRQEEAGQGDVVVEGHDETGPPASASAGGAAVVTLAPGVVPVSEAQPLPPLGYIEGALEEEEPEEEPVDPMQCYPRLAGGEDVWYTAGPQNVRVEPHWRGDRWWLSAAVDHRGLERGIAHKMAGLQTVDIVFKEMQSKHNMPELPTPTYVQNASACPIS